MWLVEWYVYAIRGRYGFQWESDKNRRRESIDINKHYIMLLQPNQWQHPQLFFWVGHFSAHFCFRPSLSRPSYVFGPPFSAHFYDINYMHVLHEYWNVYYFNLLYYFYKTVRNNEFDLFTVGKIYHLVAICHYYIEISSVWVVLI